ncbi:unnamed protein product [Orchesella dallaii]|uniref:O-acyltransferase WSD1-like N-terminal domain-containing protein n=1 Tax=Orchesella dallaii TaxID=48710 RepID=A0ABP1RYL2_9HEXA
MSSATRGLLPFLISLVFYIIIGPILLILCLLNELVRLLIRCYLWKKYEGKIDLVPDGADALWALKRQDRTRTVVVCLKTDKPVPHEKVKENFRDVILQARDSTGKPIYSKLTKILVTKLGYACWKRDENFDLNNHFRSLPSNKIYSKKEIQKEIKQMVQDMEEDKPQWEIVTVPRFVDSKGDPETSILIFRWQHAYMDGFTLTAMFVNHMSSGFTYYIHPTKFHIPFGKKMLFYLNAIIFGPYAFILITLNKFKSFWPRQISNDSAKTQSTYTWTNSMELEAIQKLRKKVDNATIPTILENAFISAAKEILPAGRVPKEISIGELAALLPYPGDGPQNRFAFFTFNINSNQDDFERIRTSKKDSWDGITGPWIPLSFFVFKFSGRMPVFMHYVVFAGGSCSLMMSNLPLSKTRFRMLDTADVLEVWAFPPQPNDTGITVFSAAYENSVKIAVSAEPTWLSEEELERIVERMPGVLNEWVKRVE